MGYSMGMEQVVEPNYIRLEPGTGNKIKGKSKKLNDYRTIYILKLVRFDILHFQHTVQT